MSENVPDSPQNSDKPTLASPPQDMSADGVLGMEPLQAAEGSTGSIIVNSEGKADPLSGSADSKPARGNGKPKKPKLKRSYHPGYGKGKWDLEKVRKKGIRKYIEEEGTGRKVINPVWRALGIQYNPECAEFIIDRIREGEPLHRILERVNMPSYATLCQWMKKMKDFGEEIRAAKADAQFLENEKMGDSFKAMHADVELSDPKVANAKAALYKEEVGYKKWSMEKLAPKTFAPKPIVDNSVNIRQVSFIVETSGDKKKKEMSAASEHPIIDITPTATEAKVPAVTKVQVKSRGVGLGLAELIGEVEVNEEEVENV